MKVRLNKKQYKLISEYVKKEIKEQGSADVNSEPSAGTSQTQSGGQGYPQVGKWESGATRGPANQLGVTKWSDIVGSKVSRGKANQLKEDVLSEQKIWEKPESFKDKERPSEPIPASQDPYWNKYQVLGRDGRITYPYRAINVLGDPMYWVYKSPLIDPTKFFSDPDLSMIGYKNDVWKRYETETNNWLIANRGKTLKQEKDFYNRISTSGKEVPKGFDPTKYDEYLNKKDPISKKLLLLKIKRANKKITEFEKNEITLLEQMLKDLEKQYKSLEFSYGLTPEERKLYDNRIKEINNEYDKQIEESYKKAFKDFQIYQKQKQELSKITGPSDFLGPGGEFERGQISSKVQSSFLQPAIELQTQKNNEIEFLNFMFGRDDWYKDVGVFGENFDRWWDKWGDAVQIGGNLLVIAFSGGIAGLIEGSVVGAARIIGVQVTKTGIKAIAPYAADAMFNAAVGGYQLSRNQYGNALISLLCTIVPFVSYGKNIGRISLADATDLVNKLKNADLTTPEKVQFFVNSLSDKQRYIFRNASTLSKEGIKKGYDEILTLAKQGIESTGTKIPKSTFKQWGPPLGKVMALEGGVPFLGGMVNGLYEFFKQNTKYQYTQQDLTEIKEFLKSEISNMTVPQAISVAKEITINPETIKDPDTFKKSVLAESLEFNKNDKSQAIESARLLGLPDDYFINNEKYKDTPIKDLRNKTDMTIPSDSTNQKPTN